MRCVSVAVWMGRGRRVDARENAGASWVSQFLLMDEMAEATRRSCLPPSPRLPSYLSPDRGKAKGM